MESSFYKESYGNGIYAVSCPLWTPAHPEGAAVMQTWVVAGAERTLAIDSPVPEVEGFRAYLEKEFHQPVMMMNSHGHIDHTGCNGQFDRVWLNRRDWPLLLGGGVHPAEETQVGNGTVEAGLSYRLEPLRDYERIDLGDRTLTAIPIGGHTPGSMMIYDEDTGALFSGDSVARRILYGLSGWTPLGEYLNALANLENYKIRAVYSMHDDLALPPDMPGRIITNITAYLGMTEKRWVMPGEKTEFLRILLGESEADMNFFDFVMPLAKREEAMRELECH